MKSNFLSGYRTRTLTDLDETMQSGSLTFGHYTELLENCCSEFAGIEHAVSRRAMVNIAPEILSFDLECLERIITHASRAIMWGHLTGLISPKYKNFLEITE